MAVSAFRSSSKRGFTSDRPSTVSSSSKDRSSDDSRKKTPLRRSRSMAPRSRGDTTPRISDVAEYCNTTDNPLFGCSSSSPTSESEHAGGAIECDAFDGRRGRSISRNSDFVDKRTYSRIESGRRLSRDVIGRRRLRYLSRGHYGISQVQRWEDRVSTGSLSEAEESSTSVCFQNDLLSDDFGSSGIYETVRSEVGCAVSEITTDIEHVIRRKKPAVISMDNIVNILPDLVNPDAIGLVSDITREYAIKLEQDTGFSYSPEVLEMIIKSQERARKLRADLAVEEQRKQGLSKILKEMLLDPKSSETRKSQIKRKASVERKKMSRRLAEDAMNYFDECVSLSTFDGSDFSSQEDQQTSSTLSVIPTGSSRFFSNGCSTLSASNYPNSQFEYHEGLDNNTKCSQSIVQSDLAISSNCSGEVTDLIHHNNGHDDLPELDTPRSGNFYFALARESTESVGLHEIRSYMKKFEKDKSKCGEDGKLRSSYNSEDYASNSTDENLLFEKLLLKNRIESGCLLVCNIRIF